MFSFMHSVILHWIRPRSVHCWKMTCLHSLIQILDVMEMKEWYDQKCEKSSSYWAISLPRKTFRMGLKVVKSEQTPKTLYLLCQPCNKLVYLFKTPSKCLFWVCDGWVSETATDPGLYEPLLACLCAGFPRSADHFPLLLPECDTFSVFSMIIPNSGSYNMTIQNPKHSFKTKPKILIIIVRRGRDWRLLSFIILLPCLGLFNGLLCFHWNQCVVTPLQLSSNRNAASERRAWMWMWIRSLKSKPRPLIIIGTEKFRNNINNSNNKQ